jgi:hypothetical protein
MTKRSRAVSIAALLTVLGAAGATVTAVPAAASRPHLTWAAADAAEIHPGTQMYTAGAQCTANFVFRDKRARVYVGYAAHCAGKGESTDTDGCTTASLPMGTRVTFNEGGNLADEGTRLATGRLVYSSWATMQELGTSDPLACAYNDFALVRLPRAAATKVNPSIPVWGGPTGIDRDGTAAGDRVWTYGDSSLRGGAAPLAPHTGVSLGDSPADGGWSHPLYTVLPGIPGDSGSAFLSADGKAVGVLSTLGLAPLPASNNIGDLAKELAFAQQHAGIRGLRLVKGTEPFSSPF